MGIAVMTPIEKLLALLGADPLKTVFEEMTRETEEGLLAQAAGSDPLGMPRPEADI